MVPIDATSVFATYCAIKPLTAALAASLVSEGMIAYEQPVRDIVPELPNASADVTLSDLLEHRSGRVRPSMYEGVILPERAQRERLCAPSSWSPLGPGDSRYTEVASWALLAWILERACNERLPVLLDTFLRRTELDRAFDLEGADSPRRRVGRGGASGRPLMLEATSTLSSSQCPGYGGFASTEGIARLLSGIHSSALGSSWGGIAADVGASLIEPAAN